MDPNDIRTLKILEELDNDHAPSQRDLARSLGVSLGLINSFIKRLVNRGYFKVTTIPRKRAQYILTPKGAAEKTRLTYEYISRSYRFYKETRQRLRELFDMLYEQGVRRVVIYGANDLGEIAYISLQQAGIESVGIIDDKRYGDCFMGEKIWKSENLRHASFDKVLIASLDSPFQTVAKLQEFGITKNKIAML